MSNITYRPRNHPAGPRHYLDGQPIHCGCGLDLLTPIGWLPGRFELAHKPPATVEGPLVEDGKVPMFYTQLPVHKGHTYATGSVGTSISFRITEHHVFRWPASQRRERRAQLAEPPPRIERWEYCSECSTAVPPRRSQCGECTGPTLKEELAFPMSGRRLSRNDSR